MSRAPATIPRTRPPAGLDYEALLDQAISITQTLSGDNWTNYNESDPGVTILQQLCYALTELSYRASFSVPDLLGPTAVRGPDRARHGLFPPGAILPGNPVTAADFVRLINDRIPRVANCWFIPHTDLSGLATGGLYDVSVMIDPAAADPAAVLAAVRSCHAEHRALCEDIHAITALQPVTVAVDAVVEVLELADVNAVLAGVLFNLALLLAPEPRRCSLADMLAAGDDTATIFRGPPMLAGFITDDQIARAPGPVPVDNLLGAIARADGVLAVHEIEVRTAGHQRVFRGGDTIPLPPGSVFRLDCSPRHGRFGILAWRGTALPAISPARVERLLAMRWLDQRRRFDLPRECADYYTWPVARELDLSGYVSVQDQFPAIYGIGAFGLPADAPPARQALARQLKGYLMPFDQLMADYFSQLAFIGRLFSIDAGGTATYAFQSLAPVVPDAAPLLAPDYAPGLGQLVAAHDPVLPRQTAILDLLLSLYARALPPPAPSGTVDPVHLHEVLLAAKQRLMNELVPATRDRGRGFDTLHPARDGARAGLEMVARPRLRVLSAATSGDSGATRPGPARRGPFGRRAHGSMWPAIESAPGVVEALATRPNDTPEPDDSPFEGRDVAQPLLTALALAEHYRLHVAAETGMVALACRDTAGVWWVVGDYADAERAVDAAAVLIGHARLHRHLSSLYVVEWVLLRFADAPEASTDNAQRVTALLPAPPPGRDARHWRRQATAILRENTPAHLALDCLFLARPDMERFAELHDDWVIALRGGHDSEDLARACLLVKTFLRHHLPDTRRSDPPAPREGGIAAVEAEAERLAADVEEFVATVEADAEKIEQGISAELTGPIEAALSAIEQGVSAAVVAPIEAALGAIEHGISAAVVAPAEASLGAIEHGISAAVVAPIEAAFGKIEQAATVAASGWLFSRLLARWPRKKSPSTAPATPVAPVSPPAGVAANGAAVTASTPPPAPPVSVRAGGSAVGSPVTAPPPAPSTSVQHAPAGAPGFDCDTALTASTAQAFAQAGLRFAVRYLSRSTPSAAGDLNLAEAQTIVAAGLGLMAVQHVAPAGWAPTATLGQSQGQAAVANARAAGLPPGMNLWLDLEGVASGTDASNVSDFCDAWYTEASAAGYPPGLYVGANCGLTGEQLYEMLSFAWYWQSGSQVPMVSTRGYCMVQTISSGLIIDGVAYDQDTAQADDLGNTPVWAVRVGSAGT